MLNSKLLSQINVAALFKLAQNWQGVPSYCCGEVENWVWACQRSDGSRFVLRLSPESHRKRPQLEAELAWLQLLQRLEVPVCKPLASVQGQWLYRVELAGEHFWALAFEWIAGKHLTDQPAEWSPEHIQALGRLLAQLHLSLSELPPEVAAQRPDWDQGAYLEQAPQLLGRDQPAVLEAFEACKAKLALWPQAAADFGLIHGDAHAGNLLWQGTNPVLFDFDDAHRGWLAQDLAIVVYYAHWRMPTAPEAFFVSLPQHLLAGYSQLLPVPERFSSHLPLLIYWRHLQLYLFLKTRYPTDMPPKAKSACEQLQIAILKGLPDV